MTGSLSGGRLAALCLGLAIFSAQFLVRGTTSLENKSPIWDEPMHLYYGWNFLAHGPLTPPSDHPYPVTALLAAGVLLSGGPATIAGRHRIAGTDRETVSLVAEDPRNLRPARGLNLTLALVGAVALGLLLGALAGWPPGLALGGLLLLDPEWIAHGRWLTTDTAHALGFALAALGAYGAGRNGTRRWQVLAIAGTVLALCSKFSGLILLVLVPLAAAATAALCRGPRPVRARALALARGLPRWVLRLSLPALLFWLAVFHIHAVLAGVPVAAGMEHLRSGWDRFLELRATAPPTALFGTYHAEGTLLYFPALLLVKTPIGVLCAAVAAAAVPTGRRLIRLHGLLFVLPVAWAMIAIASHINIGYRHFLPALIGLWILAAFGLAGLWALSRVGKLGAAALLLTLAAETLSAHPHYLAFSNHAFGGVDRTYRAAVDSTSDWGQDLPLVADLEARLPDHVKPLHLSYFGSADPRRYGIESVRRPCGPQGRPPSRGELVAGCHAGAPVLAISATCYRGVAGSRPRSRCWERLWDRGPDLVLGGSILVFFGVEPAR